MKRMYFSMIAATNIIDQEKKMCKIKMFLERIVIEVDHPHDWVNPQKNFLFLLFISAS